MQAAFELISSGPGIGSLRYSYDLDIPGLRAFPVQRFDHAVFYVEADGHPNHNVWHAACQALKGGHRYALQKFKELPRVSGEWVLEGGAAKPKWKNKDEL